VLGEQFIEPAGVAGVDVGEHDGLDVRRIQSRAVHVGQQHRAVAPAVEQDGLVRALNQAGKPPARGQARPTGNIVERDLDAQFNGLGRARARIGSIGPGQCQATKRRLTRLLGMPDPDA
jgi:hypothetical protein